jgi:hypothetical protein
MIILVNFNDILQIQINFKYFEIKIQMRKFITGCLISF